MSVPSLLNVKTTPMTPLVVSSDASSSPFHAPNKWTTLPYHKFEKIDLYPKARNITSATGGNLSPITATGGTYTRLTNLPLLSMFDTCTIYHGNKDLETIDFDRLHFWLRAYPDRDVQTNIEYNMNHDTSDAMNEYAKGPQELFMDLPVFHSEGGPHASLYMNKLANDFRYEIKLKPISQYVVTDGTDPKCDKIEVFLRCWMVHINESERVQIVNQINSDGGNIYPITHFERKKLVPIRGIDTTHIIDLPHIKGNITYFFFVIREKADEDSPNAPRYFSYLPWHSFCLKHSGNKEIITSQGFKENFQDLKKWFTLPYGSNFPK
eukprot:gene3853-4802_t